MCAVDFDAVQARPFDIGGRLTEIMHELRDFPRPHDQRHLVMHERWNAGRAPDRLVLIDEHPALVVHAHGRELHHDSSAVFVYGRAERIHRRDTAFIVDIDNVIKGTDGAPRRRYRLGDAKRNPALRALAKIGDLPLREDVFARVAVLRTMGGLKNAISKRKIAEREGLPYVRKCHSSRA